MGRDFEAIFAAMREQSRSMPPPDLAARKAHLRALRRMIVDNQARLARAAEKDFGRRSRREVVMAEVMPAAKYIDYQMARLGRWMAPERRGTAWYFLPAKNRVFYQPKGVVAIIAPWNYPFQLAFAPLSAALAAGNRVIVKPSEATPHCAELIAMLIGETFDETHVAVANGGAGLAASLCALPFDHILFTGSTRVGRMVMKAAAENLTPVTLELGGKSPAIVHEDFPLEQAAERIAVGKLINAGQTCIAPDYVLVPAGREGAFADAFAQAARSLYGQLHGQGGRSDYGAIINDHHRERLEGLVADARAKGAQIVSGGFEVGADGEAAGQMSPVMLRNVRDDMAVMGEEIFGPVLPLVPYESLNEAIAYVNARPRPLALYYFDRDSARIKHVLERTVSGGAAVNDTIMQFAQDGLPFGGIGDSGMGAYHGREGFLTFSHAKGVFQQRRLSMTGRLNPPYGALFDKVVRAIMRI